MPEILLVEDNQSDAEFILEGLGQLNLANRVKIIRDGQGALDYLCAVYDDSSLDMHKQPKLIILDLDLPKVDGFEVLRRIRSNDKTKSIPVVVFTSSIQVQNMKTCYQLGANSFIEKPALYENFVKVAADIGLYWACLNML